MKEIALLEMHLVHACNFSCESCSHYSDQGHNGVVSLAEAHAWMTNWNGRLRPATINLLGGEPTLHPQLAEFILLAHVLWPQSRLQLKTNGSFLHRHPDLPMVLKATGTTVFVSLHHADERYRQKLQPALDLLDDWRQELGIRSIQAASYQQWTRRYRGRGADMEPFEDGQPRASWENCPARAHQLFEGKIWKCAPLAYLKLQDAKYGLSAKWRPYLEYQPLDADCSDEQLEGFFGREDEAVCGMCSARPERFDLPIPLASLRVRAAPGKPTDEGRLPDSAAQRR
jgi:hypothetical protein